MTWGWPDGALLRGAAKAAHGANAASRTRGKSRSDACSALATAFAPPGDGRATPPGPITPAPRPCLTEREEKRLVSCATPRFPRYNVDRKDARGQGTDPPAAESLRVASRPSAYADSQPTNTGLNCVGQQICRKLGGGTPCLGGTMQFKPVSFKGQLNSWAQSGLRSSRTQRLRNATDLNTTRIRHFLWPTCFPSSVSAGTSWAPPPPPPLTSSPKVGDGPQLIVLSSAATMMLLFLQTGRGGHRRVQQPEPHTQEPQGPDLPASSAPQVPGLLGGRGDHFWVNTHIGKRSD